MYSVVMNVFDDEYRKSTILKTKWFFKWNEYKLNLDTNVSLLWMLYYGHVRIYSFVNVRVAQINSRKKRIRF